MTLGQKQRLFSKLIGRLIGEIYVRGYECTFGDAWAKTGHMDGSMHYLRLAIDLNLFKDGVYLTKTDDHALFGAYWESLNQLCRWGGRFGDGNHYSLTHGGKA